MIFLKIHSFKHTILLGQIGILVAFQNKICVKLRINFCSTHLWQMFRFIPPQNTAKPNIFCFFFKGLLNGSIGQKWVTEFVYLKDTHCQSLDCTMGSYLWNQVRIRGKQIEMNENIRVNEKVATKTKRNQRRNLMIEKLSDANKEYFLKETIIKEGCYM